MLKQNERTLEFFLTEKEPFTLPKKIYGNHSIVNRWIRSFENNSDKNMGIILSGIKGSGKTITAQKFCIDSKLPVIIINEAFHGQNFVDFITNPKLGKCIIFIDEFEKIYPTYDRNNDNLAQNELLSLMDGNFMTNLIFLLTVNEFRINEYLINRLNRVKYRKHYNDLDESVVNEVIDDLLVYKQHTQSIHEFFDKINMCTFDLLVNIIKEINLFNESALECAKYLNLQIEEKTYEVFEIIDGKEYKQYNTVIDGTDEITIERIFTKHIPENFKNTLSIHIPTDGQLIKISKNMMILEANNFSYNGKEFIPVKFKLKEAAKFNLVF